jgi:hypothetical protein
MRRSALWSTALRAVGRALGADLWAAVVGVAVVACANGRSGALDDSAAIANDTNSPTVRLPGPTEAGTDGDGGSGGASGSGSGSGGSDGSAAAPPPDASSSGDSGSGGTCVPPLPGGACGLTPQCGCAAGMTCDDDPSGSGLTLCVSAGTEPAYRSCTTTSQCAVGLSCMDGACKPLCNTAADCLGAGRTCDQVRFEGFAVPGWLVCSSACDPTNPGASCGPGVTCLPGGATSTDCVGPAGGGTGPASCGPAFPCAPGYDCVYGADAGTYDCHKWCKVGGSDCAAGETCGAPPTGSLVLDGTTYGVCM